MEVDGLGLRQLQANSSRADTSSDGIDSRAMPRFLRKGVLCLVVLVAGCQSSADPTTTVTPTTTTVPLGGTAEPQVYEMLALASHPNGMQLRVDRVELLADSVVVSGSLTNGSPYGISIDGGTTKLDTDSGEVAGLLEGLPEGPIPPRWRTATDDALQPCRPSLHGDARPQFRRRIVNGEPSHGVTLGAVGAHPTRHGGIQTGTAQSGAFAALCRFPYRRRTSGRRYQLQ